MGVLAALVFIGIVVAAMVKNTGSQVEVSRGYGTMATLASTTSSGFIASESWLAKTTNAQSMKVHIDKAITEPEYEANNAAKFYMIGSPNGKVGLGSNSEQFFSSRLFKIKEGPNKAVYSGMEVFSGKKAGGKSMKTAVAFGQLEGISIKGTGSWNTQNAFMAGGGVPAGNGGMNVVGKSTFCGDLKVQNFPYIFSEDVWVEGNLEANTSSPLSEFTNKVYVGGDLKIQNNASVSLFKNKVGINGNLDFQSAYNFNMTDDLWINGSTNITSKKGTLEFLNNANIHYNSGANGLDPLAFTTNNPNIQPQAPYIKGFYSKTPYPTGIENISEAIGMEATLASRKDAPLPQSFVTGMESYAIELSQLTFGTTDFSGGNLDTYYNKVSSGEINGVNLYNDHLVIRIRKDQSINANSGWGKLTKKVMFIIEEGATFRPTNGFYDSDEDASTLIYAKPGAKLDLTCDSDFRGLIYVDPLNTENHTLQFAQGKTITGAIHLHGTGNLTWNSGSGNNPVKIEYSSDVLGGIVGTIGKKVDFDESNTAKTIKFKVFGYYYR